MRGKFLRYASASILGIKSILQSAQFNDTGARMLD